ncbi:MAG: GlsB/YeaQ/YmgE family stress response membrane protein, partial [Bdellovibrionales bacterium]|nr:GlsB/YeaQ/YmgE family stress response membrane protein [Bdellovibrionales bacterium]
SLLGIGGAFVATYVGKTIGLYQMGEPAGFIASVLGAIGILIIANFVKK